MVTKKEQVPYTMQESGDCSEDYPVSSRKEDDLSKLIRLTEQGLHEIETLQTKSLAPVPSIIKEEHAELSKRLQDLRVLRLEKCSNQERNQTQSVEPGVSVEVSLSPSSSELSNATPQMNAIELWVCLTINSTEHFQVKCPVGSTVQEALCDLLKSHGISSDDVKTYRSSSGEVVEMHESANLFNKAWIRVEMRDRNCHSFTKCLLELSACYVCEHIIVVGVRCTVCSCKVHTKCAKRLKPCCAPPSLLSSGDFDTTCSVKEPLRECPLELNDVSADDSVFETPEGPHQGHDHLEPKETQGCPTHHSDSAPSYSKWKILSDCDQRELYSPATSSGPTVCHFSSTNGPCNTRMSQQPANLLGQSMEGTLQSDCNSVATLQLMHLRQEKCYSKSTHHFVRKNFLSLAWCDYCSKSFFLGLRCLACNCTVHQKCARRISPVCSPATLQLIRRCHVHVSEENKSPAPPEMSGRSSVSSLHQFLNEQSRCTLGSSDSDSRFNVLQDSRSPPGSSDRKTTGSGSNHDLGPCSVLGTSYNSATLPAKFSGMDAPVSCRIIEADSWEIDASEIRILHKVGSGSYGTVHKAIWHGFVAVKTLNVSEPNKEQMQSFGNEVAVLRKTRHNNILLFMGSYSIPQLAIVTQWCEGSTLYNHLHVSEFRFDLCTSVQVAQQIATGMEYLHAKSIIHRDLKSNNIFLLQDLTVKIGDFGLAAVKQHRSRDCTTCQPTGSILWMAPEVIRLNVPEPYSPASDVYSYGIVLFELVSNRLPYAHVGHKDQILYMVGRGYLRPDLSLARPDCPRQLRVMCQNCINYDRAQRPTFVELVRKLNSLKQTVPRITRTVSERVRPSNQRLADPALFRPVASSNSTEMNLFATKS